MCPYPSEKGILLEGIIKMFDEILSWWTASDFQCRQKTTDCLMKEQQRAITMLLCEGKQSQENVAVLREVALQPMCQNSKQYTVCHLLMTATEPEWVKYITGYMGNTTFCVKYKKRFLDFLNRPKSFSRRERRQYDLMTIYDIYSNIFCSADKHFNAILIRSNPATLEKVPQEMHFLIVLMRFRGSACCLLQFSKHHQDGTC
jgi:hypothetical protein